ncbi:hypothetical protein [Leptotrichia sp. oral taxon 212]|jgi:hypothetical protein|uniref:hypothetical protein n=1 Tax=Leptotrichia sp. oral taxon 212 TaxID=712357 RepID=UPI0006A96490|nr:hypothetical protein [Leptotrichia sp. oral taxon 212]ALA96341.1 hypothetical protein AMK43_10305 [Leptotrichia sp. oral taxon 212]
MKTNLFVKIILIFIVTTVISVIAIKNLINVKYRELVVDESKKIHIIEVHLKENNKEQELEILHNGMVLGNISEKISGLGYKNKNIILHKIEYVNNKDNKDIKDLESMIIYYSLDTHKKQEYSLPTIHNVMSNDGNRYYIYNGEVYILKKSKQNASMLDIYRYYNLNDKTELKIIENVDIYNGFPLIKDNNIFFTRNHEIHRYDFTAHNEENLNITGENPFDYDNDILYYMISSSGEIRTLNLKTQKSERLYKNKKLEKSFISGSPLKINNDLYLMKVITGDDKNEAYNFYIYDKKKNKLTNYKDIRKNLGGRKDKDLKDIFIYKE